MIIDHMIIYQLSYLNVIIDHIVLNNRNLIFLKWDQSLFSINSTSIHN